MRSVNETDWFLMLKTSPIQACRRRHSAKFRLRLYIISPKPTRQAR